MKNNIPSQIPITSALIKTSKMPPSKGAFQTLPDSTSQKRTRHEALCEPQEPKLDSHEKRMAREADRVAIGQSLCASPDVLQTDIKGIGQGRNYLEAKHRLPHGTLEGKFVGNVQVDSAEYEYPDKIGRKYQATLYHRPLNKNGRPERRVVVIGDTADNDIDARWELIGKLIAGVMLECSRETEEVARRELLKKKIQALSDLLGEMSTETR